MTVKLLTAKRGPLQGISLESILRSAYAPGAVYRETTEGEAQGVIVIPRGQDEWLLDTVIDLHDE